MARHEAAVAKMFDHGTEPGPGLVQVGVMPEPGKPRGPGHPRLFRIQLPGMHVKEVNSVVPQNAGERHEPEVGATPPGQNEITSLECGTWNVKFQVADGKFVETPVYLVGDTGLTVFRQGEPAVAAMQGKGVVARIVFIPTLPNDLEALISDREAGGPVPSNRGAGDVFQESLAP